MTPAEAAVVRQYRALNVLGWIVSAFVIAWLAWSCTAAQQQEANTVVHDVERGLSVADTICVDGEVLFGVVEPTLIRDACKLIDVADKALEAEIEREGEAVKAMVALSLAHPGSKAAVCK